MIEIPLADGTHNGRLDSCHCHRVAGERDEFHTQVVVTSSRAGGRHPNKKPRTNLNLSGAGR